ncbi:MAG: Spy/CpxP family protein refolding chaperone [Candidatus Riflebacteria bacterium]|nr:Spy/CpxP family protein refolding chaperone [Candidatus Riflebacteria bacterium]
MLRKILALFFMVSLSLITGQKLMAQPEPALEGAPHFAPPTMMGHGAGGCFKLLGMLKMLDELAITDEQLLKIRKAFTSHQESIKQTGKALMERRKAFFSNTAKQGKITDEDIKSLVDSQVNDQKLMMTAHLQILKEIGEILTEEQRNELMESGMSKRHGFFEKGHMGFMKGAHHHDSPVPQEGPVPEKK